jgi:hypothetical protein
MRSNLKGFDNLDIKLFAALGFFLFSIVSTVLINPDNSGVTKVKSYPATKRSEVKQVVVQPTL